MTLGWTIAVYREGLIERPEFWDCAIPSYLEAETAVRTACAAEVVSVVAAFEPISSDVVRLMDLLDGQVRKRAGLP